MPSKSYIRDTDPWWFRAAYVLGVPTIIAGVLIWLMAFRVDGNLDRVSAAMTAHIIQMDESVKMQQQMLRVLQQMCLNQTPSPQDRINCLGDAPHVSYTPAGSP